MLDLRLGGGARGASRARGAGTRRVGRAPAPVQAPRPPPRPRAGLQLCAERSRLGSSSSMALLPHYPDVGPSPPRLYRLSAGSARVMRALLITIAETPLTLTAPSAARGATTSAVRRQEPLPLCSPFPPAAPRTPGPLPDPLSPARAPHSRTDPFPNSSLYSPPHLCPSQAWCLETSASQDEGVHRDRTPERDGDGEMEPLREAGTRLQESHKPRIPETQAGNPETGRSWKPPLRLWQSWIVQGGGGGGLQKWSCSLHYAEVRAKVCRGTCARGGVRMCHARLFMGASRR